MSDGAESGRPASLWQQTLRRPPVGPAAMPPATGPELVKSDQPEPDPFADPRDYEPVRAILGRSHDACFLADDGLPYFKPWAYYLGAEAHPQHRRITLHWPGARIEVEGDHLSPVYLRLMTRRADVWRSFDPARHDVPAAGTPVIRSIRVVIEGDEAA